VSSSVLREKILKSAILKESTANYVVGKLNKCKFREKRQIASFFNSTKENWKNDHASFNQ